MVGQASPRISVGQVATGRKRDTMFAKDAKPISAGDGHRPATRQGVPSLISQDMRITGDLVSDGDVQVDGTIDGNVKTGMLTVGEKAQMRGARASCTIWPRTSSGMRFQTRLGRGLRSSSASGPPVW